MKTIAQLINWDFEANGRLELRNKNGELIYFEDSNGYWEKYNHKGNKIYYEISDGFWAKYEYDSNGNEMYYEDSDGEIIDNRTKTCENKIIEIDGQKYKLTKL